MSGHSPESTPTRIAARLPLRPTALAVLAALADGPRSGFGILERANEALPVRPILGPGTLYRVLRELRQEELIEQVAAPPGEEAGDERRHYHGLTAEGRATLLAEAARLRHALASAELLDPNPGRP